MRMSSRLRWLGSPLRACSAKVTRARDCSERGRRAGSAWLTWVSQRRRAGAGSHRAIQWRVRCSQVRWRLRGTGCSPRWPIRYGDGGGRARYGGYVTLRRGVVQSCTYSAECAGCPSASAGGGGVSFTPCATSLRGGLLLAGPATALAEN